MSLTGEQEMVLYRYSLCGEDLNLSDPKNKDILDILYPNDEPSINYSTLSNMSYVSAADSVDMDAMRNGDATTLQQQIEDILLSKVVIAVAAFGLIGNILNVLVLSQKGLQTSMGRMEKFAHTGLIALAVSDIMFCLTTLPHAFVPIHQWSFSSISFSMLYGMYRLAFINIFILSSCLLTVAMAAGRYCAIVHPLRARQFFGMTCARNMVILVYVCCIAFNLPRFWRYEIVVVECAAGHTMYARKDGPFKDVEVIYLWCYFIIGILLPLIVLAYCNLFLIKALRQSKHRIIRFRQNEPQQETSQRITLTLVIIVIFYLVLAIPAELISVLKQIAAETFGVSISNDQMNLVVAIVNVLQTVNFSFNFVLYCIINTHFRHIVFNAVKCRWSALVGNRRGQYDSDVGESGMGTSVRSTGQTSMRTVVYSARLQNNNSCKSQDSCKTTTTTQL